MLSDSIQIHYSSPEERGGEEYQRGKVRRQNEILFC
jgi:hypothetical protein